MEKFEIIHDTRPVNPLSALRYLGGADLKILERAPSDKRRYTMYGLLSVISIVGLGNIGFWYLKWLSNLPREITDGTILRSDISKFADIVFSGGYDLVFIFVVIVYLLALLIYSRYVLSQINFFNKKKGSFAHLAIRLVLAFLNGLAVSHVLVDIGGNSLAYQVLIAITIFVIAFDALPYFLKFFKKETPYDYLQEIDYQKKKKSKEESLNLLKSDLDKVTKGEPIEEVNYNELTLEGKRESTLCISYVRMSNIRSIQKLELDLKVDSGLAKVVSIIGDNGVGKSTIIRAIALGITDEGGSLALMKILDGPLVKYGEQRGRIDISLIDKHTKEEYTITTTIEKDLSTGEESLSKKMNMNDHAFIYNKIFVCGYGSQRSLSGDKSIATYSAFDALKSLFSASEKLLNPELLLRRQLPEIQAIIISKVARIFGEEATISLEKNGLKINKIAASAASDGYKSTLIWIMDLFGRAISYGMLQGEEELAGIVLIDELEQHLHPKWQRYVIQRLKKQFPGIQFIISTHTPLLVSGTSDFADGLIFSLEQDEGEIRVDRIKNEWLHNQHAGKVLQDAFHMDSTKSPKSLERIREMQGLLEMEKRTKAQEDRLTVLRNNLSIE